MEHDDRLVERAAGLFAALANPVRVQVVQRLAQGPASSAELLQLTEISQPLLSHHLKSLREAHLVEGVRHGRSTDYRCVDTHVAHIVLDAIHHMKEHQDDHDH